MSFSDLQSRAADRIKAAAYFADITVVEISDGDISTRLAQALAAKGVSKANPDTKLGMAVIVALIGADSGTTDSPRLTLQPKLLVAVLMNALTNLPPGGTGKKITAVVEEVIGALHWYETADGLRMADRRARYRLLPEGSIRLLTEREKEDLYGLSGGIAYGITFSAEVAL